MENLTPNQQTLIQRFLDVVNVSQDVALICLISNHWMLQDSINAYYENPDQYQATYETTSSGALRLVLPQTLTQPKSQPKAHPKGQPKSQPKTDPKSEPKSGTTEPKVEPKTGSLAQGEPDHLSEQPKQQPKEPLQPTSDVERIFFKYKGSHDTIIFTEIDRMLNDAKINDEIDKLIFYWLFDLDKHSSGLTKEKFEATMSKISAQSLDDIRQKVSEMKKMVKDHKSKSFCEFYGYLFKSSRSSSAKTSPMKPTDACKLWYLIFGPCKLIDMFTNYLHTKEGMQSIPTINKDIWACMPHLIEELKDDVSKYDYEAAYPTAIDDFIKWSKQKGLTSAETSIKNTDSKTATSQNNPPSKCSPSVIQSCSAPKSH